MSKKYNKNIHRFIALSLFLINCVVFNYKCVWADKMVESNLNEIFISEDNYAYEMKEIVEPYLNNLEKSGYIIREKRPGNAKTYEISLSESGEKLYLKLKDKLTEWWGELLVESKIDPEPFSEQLKTLAKSACEKTAGMGNQEKRSEKTR